MGNPNQCATLGCSATPSTSLLGLPACGDCAELPLCDVDGCAAHVETLGDLCPVCEEIENDTL